MKSDALPYRLLGAALAWAATGGTAAAWDSTYPLLSGTPSQISPVAAAVDGNGRLWASAYAMRGVSTFVYDTPDAAPRLLPDNGSLPSQWARARGGMVALLEYCEVVRYDDDGTLRWRQMRQDLGCGYHDDGVKIFATDVDGGHWLRARDAVGRLGSDGRILKRIGTVPPSTDVTTDPRDGRLFLSTVEFGPDARPQVTAYDRHGDPLWVWRGNPGAQSGSNVRAVVAGDGSLRVAGVDAQGLFTASVDVNGATTWNRTVVSAATLGGGAFLFAPLADTTGATWIPLETGSATTPALVVVTPGGETRFTRNGAALGQPAATPTVGIPPIASARLAPGNELVLLRRGMVSRVGNDGTLRFAKAVLPNGDGEFYPIADLVDVDAAGTALFILQPINDYHRYLRLTATGAEAPAPTAQAVSAEHVYAARTALPDGSLLAWTRSESGARELLRLHPDGSLAWRVPTPGVWSIGGGSSPTLVAADDRACTLDARQTAARSSDFVLSCYALADGAPLWSRTLLSGVGDNPLLGAMPSQIFLQAGGTISAWYGWHKAGAYGVDVAQVDRSGAVVATKAWPSTSLAPGAAPNSPFALLTTSEQRIVVDRSGTERYRLPVSNVSLSGSFAFDDDGGLVVASRRVPGTQLIQRYDASGTSRWTREIPSTAVSRIPVLVRAGSVFVSACCSPTYQYTVTRLALDTGAVTWTRDLQAANSPSSVQIALSPSGDTLASIRNARASAVIADVIDASTGAVRARRIEACREAYCLPERPIIDARSRLHFVEYGDGGTSTLVGWQLPAPTVRDIRLDQPGLTGAWWAPYANGEGFVLDWLPDSRTLFMPWFTFSAEGGNDPAGQRWYAIAGEVPANATRAELPIVEAVGGAFDDPQAVVRRQVGKATLSFTDCDNGTLQYAFDAPYNYGAAGTITLSRLTPATQDCLLADGSTQVRTAAPANGFDARLSGSWYEEATSGQGLQFTVQPGGIFFAPWFTFDPKGASDDPDNKRWLSIQGSLANAVNGTVELPIAQAIGGTFDRIATNNMNIVGTAKLTIQGCDHAKIDYRFDDNELAAALRGRTGTLDLIKAGGCTP